MFVGASIRPDDRLRRATFLAASALAQVGAVGLLLVVFPPGRTARQAPTEPVVAVKLFRPQLRAPSPPPVVGSPAPRAPSPASVPRPARMVQPREVPPSLPVDAPAPEAPVSPSGGEAPADATGSGGQPGGVVGGAPGGVDAPALQQAPLRPIAARSHDLASVRAGIARTLVYPPNARRNGLQGKVLVEFVLLADGWIRDLVLRASSGHSILDGAALSAVQAAAPFPPPGVDVLIDVPVVFRAE